MHSSNISPKKSRIELLREFESAPDTALFRQETVCALRDCSSATLERDRWVGGGVPYLKIGRNVRYRKKDILVYLDARLMTSTSDKGCIEEGRNHVG